VTVLTCGRHHLYTDTCIPCVADPRNTHRGWPRTKWCTIAMHQASSCFGRPCCVIVHVFSKACDTSWVGVVRRGFFSGVEEGNGTHSSALLCGVSPALHTPLYRHIVLHSSTQRKCMQPANTPLNKCCAVCNKQACMSTWLY
jgi:hypothetical protein